MNGTIAQYLSVVFVLVIVVAVGAIVGVVFTGAEQEIGVYEHRLAELELTRVEHWLVGYYLQGAEWGEIQSLTEEMAVLYGRRIVVVDAEGTVLADSGSDSPTSSPYREWPRRELQTFDGGVSFGTVYVNRSHPTVATHFRDQLADSINRLLLWGTLVALLVAIPLALVLSRPITRALRDISAVVRRAGAGDVEARVTGSYRGELGQLSAVFNAMAADLKRAAAMRRALVADTAHEVRTPISNIRGYVEAVSDGLVSSTTAMTAIQEEVTQLSHLADDLQELALADEGALTLSLQSRRIDEIIARAVRSARARIEALGIEITVHVATLLPMIAVDDKRIIQVMNNLLSNAAAYAPAGSVIGVSVVPTGGTDPAGVLVAIEDWGPGIPQEELETVFQRFYRVDHSRSRATGGSGIGLPIARHIVTAHGGRLWIENRPGGGCRAVFRLPAGAALSPTSS
ncbi:MAG: ATP-binding protein [Alkalispirochaeta sp.]